ncbi:hypothetical protein [Roseivirga sp. E12]|uniref:hypothetical protein n=1 Tax=Roseivirga sp. E12 TaxID=2819237 RepID=UPI001ABC3FFA|nr:hypothetical protein [Roseivirga sp. E12]MBO3698072.1 hypothetical protein [Roseivirga sp. E12]
MKTLIKTISIALLIPLSGFVVDNQSPAISMMTPGLVAQLSLPKAKQAIQALKNMPSNGPKLQQLIDNYNYGPFQTITKCSVCTDHFIGICVEDEDYTYTWNFPSYSNFMQQFKQLSQQLLSDISNFKPYYQPLQSALVDAMPNVSQTLQTLKGSTTANVQTNLSSSIIKIKSLKKSLDSAISFLGNYNQAIVNDFANLHNNYLSLTSVTSSDRVAIDNYAQGMACGGSTLITQWQTLVNEIQSSMTGFVLQCQDFGISTQTVNTDMGEIIGPLVSMLNQLNGVSEKLAAGQKTKNAAIQEINQMVAMNFWTQLSQFAQQEFGQ